MSDSTHYDLVIIGSGSGNSLVTPELESGRTAVVDRGVGSTDAFGGTCLNVGCIPTKMFVYAADVARTVVDAGRFGVDATLDGVRWRDIRDRVFGRIDPISEGGRDYRVEADHTEAYLGHARFVGDRELEVEITQPGGHHEVGSVQRITGDQVVIATGSRPRIPQPVLDSGVPFHTSDSIMRIEELPGSIVVVGGGVIAAEFAHVFSALGVRVTVVTRTERLLRVMDQEISQAFTDLARGRWHLHTGARPTAVRRGGEGVELDLADGTTVSGELLLVATGRVPNSEDLGLEAAGVRVHGDGRIEVDEHGRTTAPGVWTLGDVSSEYQLKHVANQEARVVAHNLTHPGDLRSFDHRYVPSAVFSDPQLAMVGLTEDQARAKGYEVTAKTQRYGDVAYGWAMEDSTGLFKVVADRRTGHLLGAHVMGPHASSLIQPVIQALSLGGPTGPLTAAQLARGQYWIHPALAEVLENALLGLEVAPHHDVTADYDPEGAADA
ncbi:mycothione reductase [Ornithinimicrobium avium]|uniref:Mycothione reductase n=1 Tax=Ornithinimicrobium avium TaxID=2283195 RepID=A0A345NLC3_9MICO|nr:mycothione reductase [Ornithinimicrobium avium]AXH95831.1 mycothione reductase [Ornithinimicrobium avium]